MPTLIALLVTTASLTFVSYCWWLYLDYQRLYPPTPSNRSRNRNSSYNSIDGGKMPGLTIRNLTSHPLELTRFELFEGKRVQTGDAISNITGAISGLLNATEFSSHETVVDGKATKSENLSVRIDPFKGNKTDIHAADPKREIVRLTFKTEGHKYETDVPSPTSKSATMKKLDRGPHELTAVYAAAGSVLAIFSSAKLNSWMGELNDAWPIGSLSIPGTHNSPTCHKALPSVRCQAVGVKEQLENGVRFLDIRVSCEPEGDDLALVHSVFPISLTGTKYFRDMLEVVYEFLDKNSSETVLISLKREGNGKGTDETMSKVLKHAYVDKKKNRWYTSPKIPTLGDVRGRIVLVRRFALAEAVRKETKGGFGIDAAAWPDNCEDGKCNGGHIRVQDFYEITETQNIEKKINYSRGHMERAGEQNFLIEGMPGFKPREAAPPLFVNFLSASNFFNASCWPERIAAKVNPAVVEYLCIQHGDDGKGPRKLKVGNAGTGIVVTDWVGANDDWDLVRCIVGMNSRLLLPQQGNGGGSEGKRDEHKDDRGHKDKDDNKRQEGNGHRDAHKDDNKRKDDHRDDHKDNNRGREGKEGKDRK